jgi:hypothetical protein
VKGSNYEYYILKNATPGNWTVRVIPLDIPPEGESFVLIEGRITETKPEQSDDAKLVIMEAKHKEEKSKTTEDIVGLNWEGSTLALRLIAPDGTALAEGINNSTIRHVKGSNYEYYILKNATPGNWTVRVIPIDIPPEGESFVLIQGRITEARMVERIGK